MAGLSKFEDVLDDEFLNRLNTMVEYLNKMGYTYEESLQMARNILNEAQRTNDENEKVSKRLDEIIAYSGTSSTEVIDARGDETVLSARLDKINRAVGDIDILGSDSRSIPETLIDHGVSVKDFGAVGDGVTDDSEAFINAAEHMEKGVVNIPDGVFIVEKLPLKDGLYYNGAGFNATILRSPSNPSGNMFETPESKNDIFGGGIYGATLSGTDDDTTKNPYNGIDFSTLNKLERFTLGNVKVEFFNRGYNGTDNDRWAYITDAQFYNNDIGIYCGEHPILVNVDCRHNDVALSGRINDMTALNCRFNYNRVGVEPHAGSPHGTYVNNSIFQNCGFFRNTEKAAELTANNIVVGGRPSGTNDGDVGFVLTSNGNMIIGNSFSQNTATAFENGAVKIIGRYNKISENKFNISGGPAIVTDNAISLYNQISDNIAMASNNADTIYPFFEAGEGNTVYLSIIKGNVIHVSGEAARDIMSIPLTTNAGNSIEDNKFFLSNDAVVQNLLKLDLHNSLFVNNYIYTAENAIVNKQVDLIRADGKDLKINDNVGFSFDEDGIPLFKNSGEAVIPDGATHVIVQHGVVENPGYHAIQLTPRTNTSGYSWWVEAATRTQFTIRRSTTEGEAMFNWRAEKVVF